MVSSESEFLYEKIVRQISEALDEGVIVREEKLPSLRLMSRRYHCSLSVVMQAYEVLEAQGRIYSVEKSGFFAADCLSAPLPTPEKEPFSLKSREAKPVSILGRIVEASNDHSTIPLGAGLPDSSYLPLPALKREFHTLLKEQPECLIEYTDELGDPGLRKEIAKIMKLRGVIVNPEEILLTNGCTEALSLAIQSCSSPGDVIVLECPIFMGTIGMLKELKRRIITVPTSPETGMDLGRLEEVLRNEDVKAVVMTALYQNPLGFVMPEEARKQVVELVEHFETVLIEDDVYHDCSFHHAQDRCLKSFDSSGGVIYCASFSKTLSPAMRSGWLIGGTYLHRCRNLKMSLTLGNSGLSQKVLARYLATPGYERHLVRLQKTMSRQAREMSVLLHRYLPEGTAISQPKGGYYLWVELPQGNDTLALFEKALDLGISIVPGKAFSPEERYGNCMRITFASPMTPEIEEGVRNLAALL
jgi:DNA-binding transcriptional MocR family regulator